MQQVDPDVLSCLDYLMASSEYLEFVGLMLDFKVRFIPVNLTLGSQLVGRGRRMTSLKTSLNVNRIKPFLNLNVSND